jgi:hypothetical protein
MYAKIMKNTNNIRRAVLRAVRRDVDYFIQRTARNFTKLINVMDPRMYAEK